MALDFRFVTFTIPVGTGRRTIVREVEFDSNVTISKANVALNGFKLEFAAPDRPFNFMEVDTDVVLIVRNIVRYQFEFQLADRHS